MYSFMFTTTTQTQLNRLIRLSHTRSFFSKNIFNLAKRTQITHTTTIINPSAPFNPAYWHHVKSSDRIVKTNAFVWAYCVFYYSAFFPRINIFIFSYNVYLKFKWWWWRQMQLIIILSWRVSSIYLIIYR